MLSVFHRDSDTVQDAAVHDSAQAPIDPIHLLSYVGLMLLKHEHLATLYGNPSAGLR